MEESIVLTKTDFEFLEALDDGATIYSWRIAQYVEDKIAMGVAKGRFTVEEARADLPSALLLGHALLNMNDYAAYARAFTVLKGAEAAAKTSGVWHYRMACAALYCGKVDLARSYAEAAVSVEPEYPWGWLMAGKLRAHAGEREAALEAVERGLALVPGDAEFLTLKHEIDAGADLLCMEYHHIDPEADEALHNNNGEIEEALEKRRSIDCILVDEAGLAAVKEIFQFEDYRPADPPERLCCEGVSSVTGTKLRWRFLMNEAGLSHLRPAWLRLVVPLVKELFPILEVTPEEVEEVLVRQDRVLGVLSKRARQEQEARDREVSQEKHSAEVIPDVKVPGMRYFDMRSLFADTSDSGDSGEAGHGLALAPVVRELNEEAAGGSVAERTSLMLPAFLSPDLSGFSQGKSLSLDEATEFVPEDEEALLELVAKWNKEEDYGRIIRAIESLPAQKRTDRLLGELARAYNNMGSEGEDEYFLRALEILRAIEESGRESHLWYFRVAYALYYLDRAGEALDFFERALELNPGDEDTMAMIAACRRAVTMPSFLHPFERRVDVAWFEFSVHQSQIKADILAGELERAAFSVRTCFRQVGLDWIINVSEPEADGRYKLIVSVAANRAMMPPLLYFIEKMPPILAEDWQVCAGTPATDSPEKIKAIFNDCPFNYSDLEVAVTKDEDTGLLRPVFYAPIFAGLDQDDVDDVFMKLAAAIEFLIGEAALQRWMSGLTIARRRPDEELMSLETFAERFFEKYPQARDFTMASLANRRVEYWLKPETDREADLYWDVSKGWILAPSLLNNYRKSDNEDVNALERQGVAAGFYYFEGFDELEPEKRMEAGEAFLKALEETFEKESRYVQVSGAALGLYRFYLNCYLWDFQRATEKLLQFIANYPQIRFAGWHSFRRQAGSVMIRNEENADRSESGSTDESGAVKAEDLCAATSSENEESKTAPSVKAVTIDEADEDTDESIHWPSMQKAEA